MIKNICPLCGSSSHSFTQKLKSPSNNYINSEYIAAIKNLSLLTCDSCGAVYPSTKVDPSIFNEIYIKYKSSHNMGWATFERTQHKSLSGSKYLMFIEQSINRFIHEFFGHNNSVTIAEIGCPFISYSYSQKLRYSTQSLHLTLFDKPTSLPSNASKLLINFSNKLVCLFWKFRKLLFCPTHSTCSSPNLIPLKKILISSVNLTFWSFGCIRYGQSCLQTSLINNVFDEVHTIESSGKSDILTIINCFDHFDDPLASLKNLMHRTSSIFFLGHDASSFGLQHRFAMTPRSVSYIQRFIVDHYPNSIFVPLTQQFGPSREIGFFCYLVK